MNLRSLTPTGNGGGTHAQSPSMLFGTLHKEIDRLFDDFTRGVPTTGGGQAQLNLVPNIDVSETSDNIVISAELPGLDRGEVEISIEDDVLSIRAEKRVEEDRDDRNYHLSERAYGVFYRAIQLPPGIDPGQVQATMLNGVLKIMIPKPQKNQAKKIEVQDQAPGQRQEGQGASGKGSKEAA
jgi:HSP20 family protein